MMDIIDDKLMRYVPKKKRPAIKEIYKDSDGYWVTLKHGYTFTSLGDDCRVVSQDKISELFEHFRSIEKIS